MLRYYDFTCIPCSVNFEDLVPSGASNTECPQCGEKAQKIMSAPRVAVYTDPAAKKQALAKRSYDHSMREAKKNAEQIASKMGGVAKAQSPWNIRSKKKK